MAVGFVSSMHWPYAAIFFLFSISSRMVCSCFPRATRARSSCASSAIFLRASVFALSRRDLMRASISTAMDCTSPDADARAAQSWGKSLSSVSAATIVARRFSLCAIAELIISAFEACSNRSSFIVSSIASVVVLREVKALRLRANSSRIWRSSLSVVEVMNSSNCLSLCAAAWSRSC